MTATQKCEYKSYQNIKWIPTTIEDFKAANLEKSIIKTVFDLADDPTVGIASEYKYIINDYVLNDFTTIYVCAEVDTTTSESVTTTTITKCYLVLPEHDTAKGIIGYSAYRVNSERILLKLQTETVGTGNTPLFVDCINGVAGEDTVDANSDPVEAPVLFGHVKLTETEGETTTTKECFAFPAKSSFLEGIHGNLYDKEEGKAHEIKKYTSAAEESTETYCYNVSYYN